MYISLRNRLRDAGIEAAALEARLIAATAAGKSTEKLLRDMRYYATDEVEKRAEAMVRRRLAGEPVAYITGVWEFRGLPMEVSRDVLIPRIDAEVPRVRVVLADVSAAAMDISRRNVERNGLGGRVSFLPADVTKQPPLMTGSFDLVVSNPPYIPTMEILTLDPSVRDYEPVWALDGGEDGLDFYRAILKNWALVIRQGGELMFEVGEDQAERVKDLMRMAGLREARSFPDTQNIQRVVAAKA